MRNIIHLTVAALLAATTASAQISLLTFDETGPFEGGSTTGTYALPGIEANLISLGATPRTNYSGTVFNVRSGGIDLGIESTGASNGAPEPEESPDAFNRNESWTFSFDVDIILRAVDFGRTVGAEEVARIQCDAWIDQSITPTHAAISFSSSTGRFEVANGSPADNATFERLFGNQAILIPAGTTVTIGNYESDLTAGGWRIRSIEVEIPSDGPVYDGLAYIASGWIYYFDATTWTWIVTEPWMYNATTGESKLASESGVDGYAYFSFPWLYSYSAASWLWIYGDMWIWDATSGEYSVLPPPAG
jgi:hypothetical protein